MKITFIYPGYENLGIEYLSAALKKNGHTTSLILDPVLFAESGAINIPFLSPYFNYSKKILKELADTRPDLVCFSCVSDNFPWALDTARKIKSNFNIPVVFGGIHPTSVPDILIKNECIDFVGVGECDEALVELAREIENGSKGRRVRNIWLKCDGDIVSNELRPLVNDLDSLTFSDKDLYYKKYKFMCQGYTIITSRGCPNACTYCANSLLKDIYQNKGEYLRRRSVENVIEELRIAKEKYAPKFIHFCDEVFTYNQVWLRKFISLYKNKINLPFACYTSPSFINEDIAGLLKEGGCYKVQMGVQTLDERYRLEILNRHCSNEQIAKAISIFRKNKIYLTCDNIFGLPNQKKEELIKMAEFYIHNKADNLEVFWLRYYPRTKIAEIAKNMGLINENFIKNTEMGKNNSGIARGGDTYSKDFSKFQLLLNLFHFMPKSLCNFILKRKIYDFFPILRPMFITALFRFFNKAKYDLYMSSTIKRYLHFTKVLFIPRRKSK